MRNVVFTEKCFTGNKSRFFCKYAVPIIRERKARAQGGNTSQKKAALAKTGRKTENRKKERENGTVFPKKGKYVKIFRLDMFTGLANCQQLCYNSGVKVEI